MIICKDVDKYDGELEQQQMLAEEEIELEDDRAYEDPLETSSLSGDNAPQPMFPDDDDEIEADENIPPTTPEPKTPLSPENKTTPATSENSSPEVDL